jgi:hypothetical protein
VATISDDHTGVQVFSQRPHHAPRDSGQEIAELRTFTRAPDPAPANFADAQHVLAHRIFGG